MKSFFAHLAARKSIHISKGKANFMSVIVKKNSSNWELPSEGTHEGTLTQAIDLGRINTRYGEKDYVELRLKLKEKGSDGNPLEVRDRCTKTLYKRSKLTGYVDALTNGAEIPAGYELNLADLVGSTCQLVIKHHEGADGRVWANVISVMRAPKDPGSETSGQNLQPNQGPKSGGGNSTPTDLRQRINLARTAANQSQNNRFMGGDNSSNAGTR